MEMKLLPSLPLKASATPSRLASGPLLGELLAATGEGQREWDDEPGPRASTLATAESA